MNKRYLKYILHAVILGGVIFAAAKYLNGEEVLNALQRFDYIYAPFILLISAGYIILKGIRFVVMMRPITHLPWGTLVRGYVAGTAATLMPGGVAARAGLMRQAGLPSVRVAHRCCSRACWIRRLSCLVRSLPLCGSRLRECRC